eukprot:tig00001182_g7480.t1
MQESGEGTTGRKSQSSSCAAQDVGSHPTEDAARADSTSFSCAPGYAKTWRSQLAVPAPASNLWTNPTGSIIFKRQAEWRRDYLKRKSDELTDEESKCSTTSSPQSDFNRSYPLAPPFYERRARRARTAETSNDRRTGRVPDVAVDDDSDNDNVEVHAEIQAKLNGKGPLKALVDTRAAFSIISRRLVEKLGLQEKIDKSRRGEFATADGSPVNVLNSIDIEVTLGTLAKSVQEFFVWENLPTHIILGADYIMDNAWAIDLSEGIMKNKSGETVNMEPRVPSGVAVIASEDVKIKA